MWRVLGALTLLGALSGVAAAAPLPPVPGGQFLKTGDNGSASCVIFCGGAEWGPAPNNKSGTCVSAYVGSPSSATKVDCNAGANLCFCNNNAPPLPSGTPSAPAGSTIKDGNNGDMNCNDYCKSSQYGTSYNYCVQGWAQQTGQVVPCSQGVWPRTVCYCTNSKPAPVQPQPPAGAWVKDGNNGTVNCDQFCGNTLANWGKLGTCVSGWGATTGNTLACSGAEQPHTVCFCKDPPVQPAAPAGAWVKDGNNGTVNCNVFCSNNKNDGGHNWGKLGLCVSGWGATSGKTLDCNSGETPHTVCFCKDAPAAASGGGTVNAASMGCLSPKSLLCGNPGSYTCANPNADNNNCGGCGVKCNLAGGQICLNGSCQAACPSSTKFVSASCNANGDCAISCGKSGNNCMGDASRVACDKNGGSCCGAGQNCCVAGDPYCTQWTGSGTCCAPSQWCNGTCCASGKQCAQSQNNKGWQCQDPPPSFSWPF